MEKHIHSIPGTSKLLLLPMQCALICLEFFTTSYKTFQFRRDIHAIIFPCDKAGKCGRNERLIQWFPKSAQRIPSDPRPVPKGFVDTSL